MSGIKPMVFMPAGTRWPWRPCFTCNVKMGDQSTNGIGETSVTLTVVGEVHRGRVGLKRWVTINARKIVRH